MKHAHLGRAAVLAVGFALLFPAAAAAQGETIVDGEKQDTSQSSFGVGFTIAFRISDEVGFRGLWGDSLTDEEDGLDSSMVWLRLSYAWKPTAT